MTLFEPSEVQLEARTSINSHDREWLVRIPVVSRANRTLLIREG